MGSTIEQRSTAMADEWLLAQTAPTDMPAVQDLTDPFGGLRSPQQYDTLLAFMASRTFGGAEQVGDAKTSLTHNSVQ